MFEHPRQNSIDEMIIEKDWIRSQVISMGMDYFKHFDRIKNDCPTCKDSMFEPTEQYENCWIQKHNYAYEETLEKYNKEKGIYVPLI